jgi:hypothetical protein
MYLVGWCYVSGRGELEGKNKARGFCSVLIVQSRALRVQGEGRFLALGGLWVFLGTRLVL